MATVRNPVLNIYLGTTACEIGEIVVRELRESHWLDETDRARIAHIFIDTADSLNGLKYKRINDRRLLNSADSSHIGIFHIGIRANTIRQTIRANIDRDGQRGPRFEDQFVFGHVPMTFSAGAGHVRNNGLAALCVDSQDVPACLPVYIQRIIAGQGAAADAAPTFVARVNIVAYLGGGTGSGCLPAMVLLAHEALAQTGCEGQIRLFCMIPEHIVEAGGRLDPRWKSNALACLIELVTMHKEDSELNPFVFAPEASHIDDRRDGVKQYERVSRWVGNRQASASQERLTTQVFLYNRTGAKDLDEIEHLVARDVCLRILDGTGVGMREGNTVVDLDALAGEDDKGLPTLFSCSCPVEIVFPAREMARGFAIKASREIFPVLTESPSGGIGISAQAVQEVLAGVYNLGKEGEACPLFPYPLADSLKRRIADDVSQYEIGAQDFQDWWDRYVEHPCRDQGPAAINELASEARRSERDEINEYYAKRIDAKLGMGPLAQAYYLASQRVRLYRESLRKVQARKRDLAIPARNVMVEREFTPQKGLLNDRQKKRFIDYLCKAVDDYLWYLVQQPLEELLTRDLIPAAERAERALKAICEGLGTSGAASAPSPELWGELSSKNQYQRHALYQEGWRRQSPEDWCPAVQDMYEELMQEYRMADTSKAISADKAAEIAREILGDMISNGAVQGGVLLEQHLCRKFLQVMQGWNILEIIDRFLKPHVPNALDGHLSWVAERIQPTVDFGLSVVNNSRARVNVMERLFIGVPRGVDGNVLVNQITQQRATQGVIEAYASEDKHRITFLSSWHGISLSMIPDFYNTSANTSLTALSKAIDDWKQVQSVLQAGMTVRVMNSKPPFSCDTAAKLAEKYQLPDSLRR